MKFLADEDVPAKLLKTLQTLGHDCVRVRASSSDSEVSQRAKNEGRILITLDKDFTNIALYPPREFDIVRIQIHPPYANPMIEAFKKLIDTIPANNLRGLIILESKGHI